MTRFPIMSVCAAVLLSTMPVSAQSVDCDNTNDQRTLNVCADQELKAADARLNATYKALTQQLDPAGLKRLKQAQRAWIAYRDAQCAFEAEPLQDGSIYPMVLSNCLGEATNAQTVVLEKHLNCEEGDVSCVRR